MIDLTTLPDDLAEKRDISLAKALDAIRARYKAQEDSLAANRTALQTNYDRSVGDLTREWEQGKRGVDSNALQRGMLRSGVRERNRAELGAQAERMLTGLREQFDTGNRDIETALATLAARQKADEALAGDEIDREYMSIAEALASLQALDPSEAEPIAEQAAAAAAAPPPAPAPVAPAPARASYSSGAAPSVRTAVQTVGKRTRGPGRAGAYQERGRQMRPRTRSTAGSGTFKAV